MTNAELAVLSLVAEQPRHGYEIEQVIEARGMREWTEVGFSSIYYLLKKLERRGWVEGRLEEGEGGPARKVYHVTPAGGESLRAAVVEALSTPDRCYPSLQLGLAHLPGLPSAQVREALRQYRGGVMERLAHVEGRRDAQRPLPHHVEKMFDYSVTMIQAELAWIEGLIDEMAE